MGGRGGELEDLALAAVTYDVRLRRGKKGSDTILLCFLPVPVPPTHSPPAERCFNILSQGVM